MAKVAEYLYWDEDREQYRIQFRSKVTEPGRLFRQRLPKETSEKDALRARDRRLAEDQMVELLWPSERRAAANSRNAWTLGDFVAEVYIPNVRSELKPSTLKRYVQELVTISPWFAHLELDEITKAVMQQFAAERKGEGVSNSTVNRGIATVNRVLLYAHDLEYLAHPPPRFRKKKLNDKKPVRWHSPEKMDQAYQHAVESGEPWGCYVVFRLNTGCRPQEARDLRVKHLKLDVAKVDFEETKNSKARVLGLFPETVLHLRQQLAWLEEQLDRELHPNDYVFQGLFWSREKGTEGVNLQRIPQYSGSGRRRYPWDPVGVSSEEKIRPHEFRHTYAAWQLMGLGAEHPTPMHIVSAALGHRSIDVTVDIYGHIQPGDHAEMLSQMPRPGRVLRVVEEDTG